jgi:hypothetical protein
VQARFTAFIYEFVHGGLALTNLYAKQHLSMIELIKFIYIAKFLFVLNVEISISTVFGIRHRPS